MANDAGQTEIADAEKTDTLPTLVPTLVPTLDSDGAPLDRVVPIAAKPALIRGAAFDLPRLDETVRSVEERIARQDTELAGFARRLERAQEAEAAAMSRADVIGTELTGLRNALETERERAREIERALFEKTTIVELGRARIEDAARESVRLNDEARALRDALAIRDATIVQVVNSLAERDSQLSALQREHAHLVPELEARSMATEQIDVDLQAARARAAQLAAEIDAGNKNVAALTAQVSRGAAEVDAAHRELMVAKAQSAAFQEELQTREWRRAYRHSQWQEKDATGLALQAAVQALEGQRDELKRKIAELGATQSTATAGASAEPARSPEAERVEPAPEPGHEPARGPTDGDTVAAAAVADELLALSQALAVAQAKIAQQSAEIAELLAEAETTQDEMTVLLAHLQVARKQTPELEADMIRRAEQKRWSEELAKREARLAELEEENQELKSTIERTRGALDEREFMIRRLERSESNNATVLGRLQNSIERLGVAPDSASPPSPLPPPSAAAPPLFEAPASAQTPPSSGAPPLSGAVPSSEPPPVIAALPVSEAPAATLAKSNISVFPQEGAAAKLIRIDGGTEVTYVLHRRTQIGRMPSLELHIDSSGVSRRHAVILTAPGGAIIEDCMSTNGTLVNGVKVSRQLLHDGDLLTIGEARFRFVAERPPARRD
jgi:predicted  nucleic acid-binding Zn-ribbon protein